MQSDGNSFGGDVVPGSFNKTYRNEDNILDQIYEGKYVRIIIVNKTQFYEFLVVMCLCAVFP